MMLTSIHHGRPFAVAPAAATAVQWRGILPEVTWRLCAAKHCSRVARARKLRSVLSKTLCAYCRLNNRSQLLNIYTDNNG